MTSPFDFAQGDTLINHGNSVLDEPSLTVSFSRNLFKHWS